MQALQARSTRRDDFQAPPQFFEGSADVAHQGLAVSAQPHNAGRAIEKRDAQGTLELADRMADSTWRQLQFGGCGTERSRTTGGLERTEKGKWRLVEHGGQMNRIHLLL